MERGPAMAVKGKQADADEAEAAGEEGEAAPAKRKLPLKLILIVAGALLLLGGAGTAGYLILSGGKESKTASAPVKTLTLVAVQEEMVNFSSTGNDQTHHTQI